MRMNCHKILPIMEGYVKWVAEKSFLLIDAKYTYKECGMTKIINIINLTNYDGEHERSLFQQSIFEIKQSG